MRQSFQILYFKTKHLQLELLPQKVVLQAEGVGGLGGLQGDGGDEEEEEERHPHSDVVNWGFISQNR